jgi:hypothetical protein
MVDGGAAVHHPFSLFLARVLPSRVGTHPVSFEFASVQKCAGGIATGAG